MRGRGRPRHLRESPGLRSRQGSTTQGGRGCPPTFGDLSILAEAAAERQGDVGQVHGGVREALGAAVGRRATHRLGGLGAGQRVGLGPLPGAGLRLAVGTKAPAVTPLP